jgi:hypothetical protein
MEYKIKKKYLKYKAKYLYLKNQIGGQRTVQIYDKNNYRNLLYEIQLDDDDDIEVLKNKLIDLQKERDFDDIEIFERTPSCVKKLNGINEKMSQFCMLIKRKQEFQKMKLATGFSLVDTPIDNTTSDEGFNSNLIYDGIVGVFKGTVIKGNYIKGSLLINLEDGNGEYIGVYGTTSIKLVGHFMNNKLNGEGKKIISFDNFDNVDNNKRHEYEYTGSFENNKLINGKINYKLSHPNIEIHDQGIVAFVAFIDGFGNAILNVDKILFENVRNGRLFKIYYARKEFFYKINKHYKEVEKGEEAILFNSSGYLEIATNEGNASQLLGLRVGSKIMIEFL